MNKKRLIGVTILAVLGIGFWLFSPRHHNKMQQSMQKIEKRVDTRPQIEVSKEFRATLDSLFNTYFELQNALGEDNFTKSKTTVGVLLSSLKNVQIEQMSDKYQTIWDKAKDRLTDESNIAKQANTIEDVRKAFEGISISMELLAIHFGGPQDGLVLKYHCPMAKNDQGASWLQNKKGTKNPYFGAEMLRCGSLVKEY